MEEWVNWSETFRGPIGHLARPQTLHDLQKIVVVAGERKGRVHPEGSRWAFSAPAYCEDVVVDTSALCGFPEALQLSIPKPVDGEPARLLVGVESGIKVRDLYRALAFDNPPPGNFRGYEGPRPSLPAELTNGRIWTLPVLGGAGGQSLAGVINTGTHGGDVARAPLSDAVRAMLLVVSGGQILLLEPRPEQRGPIVDEAALGARLAQDVLVRRDSELFAAALTCVGRLGIVYAYVIEVHDETNVAIVETRRQSTWESVRPALVGDVMGAGSRDEFLQVVINPYRRSDGARACYVTRHEIVSGHPTDPERAPAMMHVHHARSLSALQVAFQLLGQDEPTEWVRDVVNLLLAVGPPFEVVLTPFVLERVGHIGHRRPNGAMYLVGDAVADIMEFLTTLGRADVITTVTARLLDVEQRDQISGPVRGPWRVKGTRFEIADFYDYNGATFRGESIELFFPVDPARPDRLTSSVDALLAVFDTLRAEREPIGAYVSLRFMSQTRATLGLARWSPSCSVEVAMIRGLRGNARALRLMKELTLAHGGVIHWGQQHDLDRHEVETSLGPALTEWRAQLSSLHGAAMLFSTPFTRRRGLEAIPAPPMSGWTDLRQRGRGAAALPSGFLRGTSGTTIIARDESGVIQSARLGVDGSVDTWQTVRPEPVQGRPSVFRGVSGRLELFVVHDEYLRHTYQLPDRAGWSAWDVKGFPAPIRYDNDEHPIVAITAHSDGRLEAFGRATYVDEHRLAHCWAHTVNGAWSTVWHRGAGALAGSPSAVNRRLASGEDHLLVAAVATNGTVQTMHQTGPADDAGWSDWVPLGSPVRSIGQSGPVLVAPAAGPLHLFMVGPGDRIHWAGDTSGTLTPRWSDWSVLLVDVDPTSRLAAISAGNRIWVASRTLRGDVVCWDFVPGTPPQQRVFPCDASEDVALGAFPDEEHAYLTVRVSNGSLYGRRLSASR